MSKARRQLLIAAFTALWSGVAAALPDSLPEPPADAQPGECYGLVYVPPQFVVHEEQVQTVAASERQEKVPAVYETVYETVTLPATRRRKVITPAVVEVEEETVAVPARERRIKVPARYRTVSETVTLETGLVMKPGKPLPGQNDGPLCLVEVPTEQKVVQKTVLDRAASTRTVTVPASEKTVKRRKVLQPAVTEWVPVPERTIQRKVKKLVTPETTRTVVVPASYGMVKRREQVGPAHAEWQRVLCETNFTPALVQALQEALKREGEYQGPANGSMNRQTSAAVRRYQERNELPTGGLGLSTLAHLGVSLSEGQALSLRPE